MASELIVQTLKGPTTGANANKVIIPSGQTLECSSAVVAPGSILQTATDAPGGQVTSTSTTYADSNVSLTVTSTQANSKFVLSFTVGVSPLSHPAMNIKLVRRISGSDTELSSSRIQRANNTSSGDADRHGCFTLIDAPAQPAGTSITYIVQFATTGEGVQVRINDNSNSSIYLMEIAG